MSPFFRMDRKIPLLDPDRTKTGRGSSGGKGREGANGADSLIRGGCGRDKRVGKKERDKRAKIKEQR